MSDQYAYDPGFEEFLNDDYWMQQLQPDWAAGLQPSDMVQSHLYEGNVQVDAMQGMNMLVDTSSSTFSISESRKQAGLPDSVDIFQANSISSDEGQSCFANTHHEAKQAQSTWFKYKSRITYPSKNCITCSEPLDLTEQVAHFVNPSLHCTSKVDSNHPMLVCDHAGCESTFASFGELKYHSSARKHESFLCAVEGCGARLLALNSRVNSHFSMYHPNEVLACAECYAEFDNFDLLNRHGVLDAHSPYVCQFPECAANAAQLPDLARHQLSHQKVRRHPCKYCSKYRGKNGFKRKDHLRQHIVNYHHIKENVLGRCPFVYCWREISESSLIAHCIETHQSRPYPCIQKGCDRVKLFGFDTRDMLKAHRKTHIANFPCPHAGCDRSGEKGYAVKWALVKHLKTKHPGEDVQIQEIASMGTLSREEVDKDESGVDAYGGEDYGGDASGMDVFDGTWSEI